MRNILAIMAAAGLALASTSAGAQAPNFDDPEEFARQQAQLEMTPMGPDGQPWAQYLDDTMADTSQYAKDGPYTVCFSNAGVNNPWRVVGWTNMQAEVDLHPEIGQLVHVDAEGSDDKQIADINDLLAGGNCDIMIVSPNTTAALTPAVEQACAQMPVIVFDRGVNTDCPVTFIHPVGGYGFGIQGAEFVADNVESGGNVLMLRILPGVDVLETRYSAGRRILEEAGLNIVGAEFTDGDNARTKSIVEDYIQRGQIDAAAAYRHLLGEGSAIGDSHADCDKVQDPYSLRCQPQVMGAVLTQIRQAAEVLAVEVNAVSDNPLVFAEDDDIISGGNFHAEPVAMAADNLALAIAETGSLAERRISLMMDKHMSQLPPFLVENGGVNSGFMIAQVTAAALASENKALAHPHSVDSLPTSANQEDHVSMAPAAGKRLWEMADNVRGILAIEWLGACQGLDMRHGLKSTDTLEQARQLLRDRVSHYEQDRFFAPDIEAASDLLAARALSPLARPGTLPSQR